MVKNEKIINSWNQAKLDDSTHERLLNNILRRGHSSEKTKTIERRFHMKPRFAMITVAICLCLASGAGITAYAMEVKAYNTSVEYLNGYGIGTDGYSRNDVKAAYRDINSGEFKKDITLTMLDEAAQTAGIETDGKNAKELFGDINTVLQEKQITKVTSEQVRKVTADMKYSDVIALLGKTADVGFGRLILQYEVDGKYLLCVTFISLDTPCGYSGDELLTTLTVK